ncbi:MAG: hydrolase [Oscillospiraceae bacterium]|nr:hydrolase [Oscillospiraceae bacterium]
MRSPVNYTGVLRNHMVAAPEAIETCSGIRIFGRLLKSIMFSTDVAIIANTNADAVIAVYPFTPQPRIVSAVMSAADMPVFFGVGGGFTSGERSVNQALAAENMGAFGVVVNAPVMPDVLHQIKRAVDIPVIATIVSAEQDTEARLAAGADILNVAASAQTPAVVKVLRERHPDLPIMATGGPTEDSIRETVAAGANAVTFTPPDTGVLLAQIMSGHRERFKNGD